MALDQAQFATAGKDFNEIYEGAIQHIQNNNMLTNEEKDEAKERFTQIKDHQNLLFLKGPTYPCNKCGKAGYTILSCEHCIRDTLESKFSTWSSGNDIIDDAIQESQTKLLMPTCIIEWIEYKDLIKVKYLAEGGCSKIYTATWTKGFYEAFDNEKKEFIRSRPLVVILKQLDNSHNPNKEFLNEVIFHLFNNITELWNRMLIYL